MRRIRSAFLCYWYLAFATLTDSQQCGDTVQSRNGFRLKEVPYKVIEVYGVGECTWKCTQDPLCQSYNLEMSTLECMLLQNNHLNAKLEATNEDGVFMPNLLHPCYKIKCKNGGLCVRTAGNGATCVYKHSSCSSLQQKDSSLRNGYYMLNVSGTVSEVYCDMETKGGGWTLVVSISGSNRNHLQQPALCHNATVCVPHQGTTATAITAQKRSDEDIRAIAASDGVFRLDVLHSSPYTVYFKIPTGASFFSSSCYGLRCPRIITSHSFPFVWESSPCTGISVGYHIYGNDCHYVFDNHDNEQCGSMWISSKYHGERALYGYCRSNGIYAEKSAYVYVR